MKIVPSVVNMMSFFSKLSRSRNFRTHRESLIGRNEPVCDSSKFVSYTPGLGAPNFAMERIRWKWELLFERIKPHLQSQCPEVADSKAHSIGTVGVLRNVAGRIQTSLFEQV